MTDETGIVKTQYVYDPFGNTTIGYNTYGQPLTITDLSEQLGNRQTLGQLVLRAHWCKRTDDNLSGEYGYS